MSAGAQRDAGILVRHLSQEVLNLFNNGGSNINGAGGSSSVVTPAASFTPFTSHLRTLNFFSGAAVVKTCDALTLEANGAAWFAFTLPSADLPISTSVQLRPAQYGWETTSAEYGRVEIVGLSAAGVPDHFYISEAQAAAYQTYSAGEANAYNAPVFLIWNDSANGWDALRPWSKCARGSRLRLIARLIVRRDNTGSPPTGGALWAQFIDNSAGSTITDTATPTGASDADLTSLRLGALPEAPAATWNNSGVAAALPIVVAADVSGVTVVTVVELDFGSRLKVVHGHANIETYSWQGSNPGDRLYFTVGTRDQIDRTGAGNPHKLSFEFSCADFKAQTITFTTGQVAGILPPNAPGTVTCNVSANTPITRGVLVRNLDEVRIDIDVSLEISGDDLTTY